jgi:hypothetical protein
MGRDGQVSGNGTVGKQREVCCALERRVKKIFGTAFG